MPSRLPFPALVLAPVACGVLSVALACYTGARTDRLADASPPPADSVIVVTPVAHPVVAAADTSHRDEPRGAAER